MKTYVITSLTLLGLVQLSCRKPQEVVDDRITEILRLFRIHTNKEFYKWLLEHFPQWVHRVKDKHLASFMGISPPALSRIRGSKN